MNSKAVIIWIQDKRRFRKIASLIQELEKLRNKDYKPVFTENSDINDNDDSLSEEYEFEQLYTDPHKAIRIIQQIMKLQGGLDCYIEKSYPNQEKMFFEDKK